MQLAGNFPNAELKECAIPHPVEPWGQKLQGAPYCILCSLSGLVPAPRRPKKRPNPNKKRSGAKSNIN